MSDHNQPTVDIRPHDRVDPAYVSSGPDYSHEMPSPSANPHAHFIPPALLQTSSASSLPDHDYNLMASPTSPHRPLPPPLRRGQGGPPVRHPSHPR